MDTIKLQKPFNIFFWPKYIFKINFYVLEKFLGSKHMGQWSVNDDMSEMNFLGLGHVIYLWRIVVQPYDGNVNFLLIFQTITGQLCLSCAVIGWKMNWRFEFPSHDRTMVPRKECRCPWISLFLEFSVCLLCNNTITHAIWLRSMGPFVSYDVALQWFHIVL